MKINSISITSTDYPHRLSTIPGAPKQLYIRGDLPDEPKKYVTIIGTRKPTPYGSEITQRLARTLAERGVVIVSGLALGVDGIAHRAALSVGGTTIAVLGGGLETIYPASHRQLGEQMLEQSGALISEYPPGMPPMKHQFLARNRIVSGLSDALIITEASHRSGTFNTVSHALEQGRDVYAVPGPITSPMSRGCNLLIAQGASPIIDIDEFVDQIAPRSTQTVLAMAYNDAEQSIIDLLATGIRDGAQLQTKSQLDAGLFAQTLTMLEIRGAVRPLGANQWSL